MPTLVLNGRVFEVAETLDGSDLTVCPRCANRGWISTAPALPFGCTPSADHAAQIARERHEGVSCDCGAWDYRKGPKPVAAEQARAA